MGRAQQAADLKAMLEHLDKAERALMKARQEVWKRLQEQDRNAKAKVKAKAKDKAKDKAKVKAASRPSKARKVSAGLRPKR